MSNLELCTKDELNKNLRTVLYVAIQKFNEIYGGGSNLVLADIKFKSLTQVFDEQLRQGLDSFNISRMHVTHKMDVLYKYVSKGQINELCAEHWNHIYDSVSVYFRGLEQFNLFEDSCDDAPLDSLIYLLDLANARRKLDSGGDVPGEADKNGLIPSYLQLKDVALLAGIDEKTARNLANPNASNRLITTNVRGRTLVEVNLAEDWLKGRGYQITGPDEDESTIISYGNSGFYDFYELLDYMRNRRNSLELSIFQVAELAGIAVDEPELFREEDLYLHLDVERLASVAKALRFVESNLEVRAFVRAVFMTNQRDTLRRFDEELDCQRYLLKNSDGS